MEHDSDAGFHHTNPSETKKTKTKQCPACTHTEFRCAWEKAGASEEHKEELWPKCCQKIPSPHRLEMQGPAWPSIVTNCEIGHLCRSPPQDQWPHAKGCQRGQVLLLAEHKSHLSLLLPLLLLHLQSNLGRLHSFLLREVRLYCMCSLLIEILDITSPEDLEILQLNGKNTLDRRAQTDGDTLHASNINKILIPR